MITFKNLGHPAESDEHEMELNIPGYPAKGNCLAEATQSLPRLLDPGGSHSIQELLGSMLNQRPLVPGLYSCARPDH